MSFMVSKAQRIGTRKCDGHNVVLRGLEQCPKCLEAARAKATGADVIEGLKRQVREACGQAPVIEPGYGWNVDWEKVPGSAELAVDTLLDTLDDLTEDQWALNDRMAVAMGRVSRFLTKSLCEGGGTFADKFATPNIARDIQAGIDLVRREQAKRFEPRTASPDWWNHVSEWHLPADAKPLGDEAAHEYALKMPYGDVLEEVEDAADAVERLSCAPKRELPPGSAMITTSPRSAYVSAFRYGIDWGVTPPANPPGESIVEKHLRDAEQCDGLMTRTLLARTTKADRGDAFFQVFGYRPESATASAWVVSGVPVGYSSRTDEDLIARALELAAERKAKADTGCVFHAGDRVNCDGEGPGVVVETWPSLWLEDDWHHVVVRLDSTGEKLRTRSTDLTKERNDGG